MHLGGGAQSSIQHEIASHIERFDCDNNSKAPVFGPYLVIYSLDPKLCTVELIFSTQLATRVPPRSEMSEAIEDKIVAWYLSSELFQAAR